MRGGGRCAGCRSGSTARGGAAWGACRGMVKCGYLRCVGCRARRGAERFGARGEALRGWRRVGCMQGAVL